jgi:hypothetical protein
MPCNNGNNKDLMMSVRYSPAKDEITGHALTQLQKLKDMLEYKQEVKEVESVLVTDLITVYKWGVTLCSMATYLPVFSQLIRSGHVLIEDVPKFDKLMYEVMGERV